MLYFVLPLALTYAALVGALYHFQRQLIYLPEKVIGLPEQYGLEGFAEYFTAAADRVSVQLWYRRADAGFPTVVYFHGNAHHLGGRAGIYDALARKGFGVLAVSYRGYGKSGGSPSEAGLYEDGRAAFAFLRGMGIAPGGTLLYGESLGTGVAAQMATEHAVAGVILQAPFTSLAGRAAEIYYYVPVKLLIKDQFDTLSKIGKLAMPVLIFHGERDTIIPPAHGRRLYDAVTAPKKALFLPGTGHNDFDSAVISEHVLAFAETYRLIRP